MAGDNLGFEELIRLCERYTGKKIEVRRVTIQQLEERLKEIPNEDMLKRMDCQIAMACARDGSVVPGVLNEVCSVQPVKVEEFLRKYWG
jgi:Flp pilus assembly CpaE family ATPase